MNYFLNYSATHGLTINTSRDPRSVVGDIGDLVLAVTNEEGRVSCSLDQEVIDSLESDSYWSGSDVSAHAIELVYAVIMTHQEDLRS